MEELARRAVACRHWRWLPGMLATGEGYLGRARVIDTDCAPVNERPDLWEYRGYLRGTANADEWPDTLFPDLSDPATLGALLALVREAWGDPWIRVEPMSREWRTLHSRPAPFSAGPTEAAALVAALEAAP